jgi:aspartyl-tRNA(Asn)/glutamyl-tRNA(Gln) amidotransferase subunit A
VELHKLTIQEAAELIHKKEISASELCEQVFKRIKEDDEEIGAYLFLAEEEALTKANMIDDQLSKGENPGRLAGIPVAIKDVMCTKGMPTTCASKILQNYIPPYNATVVERLEAEGAIVIGKTNMDEFAMGSSTENSAFKITRNPWDKERVPGGSSGGSAAAIAAHEAIGSLGSDTGGSIRQPAALCGVVGLKPTYGRVSRYGLVAFASSLDQIGPITKNVSDAALLMEIISGKDPRDSTSVDMPVPRYTENLEGTIKGFRVGVPKEYFPEALDGEVKEKINGAIEVLKGLGVDIEEISLVHTEYAIPTYYVLAPAEASSNLARYDGVRYGFRSANYENLSEMYVESRSQGFGPEVKRRIMLGTFVLSSGYYDAYYLKAQKVRSLIMQDFEKAFQKIDLIITPTTPTPAFKIGEKVADPLQMYLSDIFTVTANLAGIAGISIPIGLSSNELPIGMQILSPPFAEDKLLHLAYALEKALK